MFVMPWFSHNIATNEYFVCSPFQSTIKASVYYDEPPHTRARNVWASPILLQKCLSTTTRRYISFDKLYERCSLREHSAQCSIYFMPLWLPFAGYSFTYDAGYFSQRILLQSAFPWFCLFKHSRCFVYLASMKTVIALIWMQNRLRVPSTLMIFRVSSTETSFVCRARCCQYRRTIMLMLFMPTILSLFH